MSIAVSASPEQRVVLCGTSWETYERLLAERGERAVPRLTYDRGVLEIMSPSKSHETLDRLIGLFVGTVAEAWEIDVLDLGHLTFKRPEWERGFESDGCFWVGAAAARMVGSAPLDLDRDPPPDIVVEIDISRDSIGKLDIFRQFGVPEVWRHDGARASFLVLDAGGYQPSPRSRALPLLTADRLTALLAEREASTLPTWLRTVRAVASEAAETPP